MKRIAYIAVILLALGSTDIVDAAEGRYTRSMFARAVKKDSASPRYVLCQVRHPQTNSIQTVCVPGHSLVEAVAIEKGWMYRVNSGKATGFALAHWKKPFVFEKPNALARVHARYSPKQLAEARARLSRLSNTQLKRQLRAPFGRHGAERQTELQRMCAGRNAPISYASREAVAHILLERGILVANDYRTGHLRLP